jgi:hypothetical protein
MAAKSGLHRPFSNCCTALCTLKKQLKLELKAILAAPFSNRRIDLRAR